VTRRAFVPAPLIEAQPRVYKSFRGRQLKGLLMGTGGAIVVLALFGLRNPVGHALAFLATLPGFAYGYYQPEGRPLEDWIKLIYRFYATPQRITTLGPRPQRGFRLFRAQFDPVLVALRCLVWSMTQRKGRQLVGR
jgi:hypothetical protein